MNLAVTWHSGLAQGQDLGEGPDQGRGGGRGRGHTTALGRGEERVALVLVVGAVEAAGGATVGHFHALTTEKEHAEGAIHLHPHPRTPPPVPVPPPAHPPAPGPEAGAETSGGGGPAAGLEHP